MFSLRLTRWLMGYVRFSLTGGSPERFLNYCARSGINLWNIQAGVTRGACVSAGRYRDLRSHARRAGVKLKILDRHGFFFATKEIRMRKGLLAGAVLFMMIIGLMSTRVWSIEVKGNKTIPTEQIQAELVNLGIVSGTPKSKVEPREIQQKLMLKFPQIGWMSFNTRGCAAEIQLKEKVDKPEIAESQNEKIYNVKAAESGQILSIDLYKGTPMVKEGDAVVKGQLLISGIVEDQEGRSTLRGASAKIIAATARTFTTEVTLKRNVTFLTGQTVTRRSFQLFGLRIPLSIAEKPEGNYQMQGSHTDIRLMNSVLPISLYEEKWSEQRTEEITLTREQALAEAKKQIEQQELAQLKDAKIVSSSETGEVSEGKLIYTVQMKCEENIAQESEIVIK